MTIQVDSTKWNKAKFLLSRTTELSVQFEWDQKWQNKVDKAVMELQKEDPEYESPKWHWEV